jgi:hypothetical protein
MKKQLIIGAIIGLIIGILIGSQIEIYRLIHGGGYIIYKINRITGTTWRTAPSRHGWEKIGDEGLTSDKMKEMDNALQRQESGVLPSKN